MPAWLVGILTLGVVPLVKWAVERWGPPSRAEREAKEEAKKRDKVLRELKKIHNDEKVAKLP